MRNAENKGDEMICTQIWPPSWRDDLYPNGAPVLGPEVALLNDEHAGCVQSQVSSVDPQTSELYIVDTPEPSGHKTFAPQDDYGHANLSKDETFEMVCAVDKLEPSGQKAFVPQDKFMHSLNGSHVTSVNAPSLQEESITAIAKSLSAPEKATAHPAGRPAGCAVAGPSTRNTANERPNSGPHGNAEHRGEDELITDHAKIKMLGCALLNQLRFKRNTSIRIHLIHVCRFEYSADDGNGHYVDMQNPVVALLKAEHAGRVEPRGVEHKGVADQGRHREEPRGEAHCRGQSAAMGPYRQCHMGARPCCHQVACDDRHGRQVQPSVRSRCDLARTRLRVRRALLSHMPVAYWSHHGLTWRLKGGELTSACDAAMTSLSKTKARWQARSSNRHSRTGEFKLL